MAGYSLHFYCLDLVLCHNWCSFFARPMVPWSTWFAFVRPLEQLKQLLALWPSSLKGIWYSVALITLGNSLIQVSPFYTCFIFDFLVDKRIGMNLMLKLKSWISEFKDAEAKALLLKASQQVNRTTEIILNVTMKVSLQLVMLPKCVASLATYFFTDSGSESFQLPIPMW